MNSKQKRLLIIGGVVSAFLLVGSCSKKYFYYPISSDALGVVRDFGAVEREPMKPGFNWKAPWKTVEPVTMAFDDMPFMEGDNAMSTRTKDGFVVEVPFTVSWAINPKTLTLVKSRQPGYYSERQIVIIRSAARDVLSPLTLEEAMDRPKVARALMDAIQAKTVAYYQAQGYGVDSDQIIRYGMLTVRDVRPPDSIVQAYEDAAALNVLSTLPKGRALAEYTKMIEAQAVAKALNDGRANVTVVTGNTPVVAVAGK